MEIDNEAMHKQLNDLVGKKFYNEFFFTLSYNFVN